MAVPDRDPDPSRFGRGRSGARAVDPVEGPAAPTILWAAPVAGEAYKEVIMKYLGRERTSPG